MHTSRHTFLVKGGAPPDLAAVLPRVVEACPGNGTRYLLVITPVSDAKAAKLLGAAPGCCVVTLWPGMRQSRAMVCAPGGYLAASYVSEKLQVNLVDSEALATIIGKAIGRPHPGSSPRPAEAR